MAAVTVRDGFPRRADSLVSSQRREKQRAIDLLGKRSLQISFRQQKLSTKRFQSGHLGGTFGALSFGDRHRGPTNFAKSHPGIHPISRNIFQTRIMPMDLGHCRLFKIRIEGRQFDG
ncbi:hypothetical protein [Mesorhizobium sp. dw_380]|uniref:hypothetical protein n=1 Tax=Mesorhizobium sp. dw_380 TaxID=2812001 RepID=UPI001BDEB677|nr:hypothetical protein [Mesorhizobium sp. dw_380]